MSDKPAESEGLKVTAGFCVPACLRPDMQFKDYYQTMGVEPARRLKTSSAHCKLARKYHPDVSRERGSPVRSVKPRRCSKTQKARHLRPSMTSAQAGIRPRQRRRLT
jgi:curved DNA-binding protein